MTEMIGAPTMTSTTMMPRPTPTPTLRLGLAQAGDKTVTSNNHRCHSLRDLAN